MLNYLWIYFLWNVIVNIYAKLFCFLFKKNKIIWLTKNSETVKPIDLYFIWVFNVNNFRFFPLSFFSFFKSFGTGISEQGLFLCVLLCKHWCCSWGFLKTQTRLNAANNGLKPERVFVRRLRVDGVRETVTIFFVQASTTVIIYAPFSPSWIYECGEITRLLAKLNFKRRFSH